MKKDDAFLEKYKVTILSKEEQKNTGSYEKAIKKLLLPKLNQNKFRRWLYYNFKDKERKIGKWIYERLAVEPIIYNQDFSESNQFRIKKYFFNNGYFNTSVKEKAVQNKFLFIAFKKKIQAHYTVTLLEPYTINAVHLPKPKDKISKLIILAQTESLTKTGEIFKIENLQKERVRLSNAIRETGYFQFNKEYIVYELDSSKNSNKIDIYLKIKAHPNDSIHKKSYIKNISVLDFNTHFLNDTITRDTLNYLFKYNKKSIPLTELVSKINIKKDEAYSNKKYNKTLNSLIALNIYKFININYKPYQKNNYDSLNVEISLIQKPNLQFEIDLEMNSRYDDITQISTSSFNLGSAIALTHSNLNTFGNAEKLSFSLSGGLENQFNPDSLIANTIELNTKISLSAPKIFLPKNSIISNLEGSTGISFGTNLLRRLNFYTLLTFNTNLNYKWIQKRKFRHQLNLINLGYLNLSNTTPTFSALINNNPSLLKSFDEQFLFGSVYSITTQTKAQSKSKNKYFFKGSLEASGNLVNGLINIFSNKPENKLFDVLLSQFIKLDSEYKYYRIIDNKRLIANRLKGGLGIAYGNSEVLPYAKQYFIGGTNSIRAFRIRDLGPGRYDNSTDSTLISLDQTGDLLFEMSSEYRQKLNSYFAYALFVDAGNIWNIKQKQGFPSSTNFRFKSALTEIAIGTGAGLRFDLNYFVLRLDAAFPIYKPFYAKGERWVFKYIDFSYKKWRQDNLIFNLAIGYPF